MQPTWQSCRLAPPTLAAFVLAVRCVSPQPPSGASDRQALVGELVVANRILANEGVLDGYGHVSVRSPSNPNHYLLARSKAPALIEAGDIVEYDLDSVPVSGSATGYIERFIHGEIYRKRPDVRSIVRCHCPAGLPFAATSVPLRPLYHMAFFIGPGVPVFEIRQVAGMSDMLIRTPELGRGLASTLVDKADAWMRVVGTA